MFEKPVEIYIGKEYGVVLHKQSNASFEMWATHEFRTDAPDDYYWGNYTPSFEEAKEDFANRVKRML